MSATKFKYFAWMMVIYAVIGIIITCPFILILGVPLWKGVIISVFTAFSMIVVNLISIWFTKEKYEGISETV